MAMLDIIRHNHSLFSGVYLTMRKDHQKFNKDIIINNCVKTRESTKQTYIGQTALLGSQSYNDRRKVLNPVIWPPDFKDKETKSQRGQVALRGLCESPVACSLNPHL